MALRRTDLNSPRDRFRTRDSYPYPQQQQQRSSATEDKSRSKAPPSRHLWVGNISNAVPESNLKHLFSQFGDLESLAFQPGRSYVFLNYRTLDAAVAALTSLQGFHIAPGFPLRIEFAKADKSSMPSRDEDYSRREEPRFQRDSKDRYASPDQFPEKSRMDDKNAEPNEVLWIGFPASLKVDELILRKAFAPFGEIEKISAIPGRTYAFVRFKTVMAASRAKETLQGNLFGNPRVHICFARPESGPSIGGRSMIKPPLSTHYDPNDRHRSNENNIRPDRDFGSYIGDPNIKSLFESQDPEVLRFNSKGSFREGPNSTFDQRRFLELGNESRQSEDMYEHRISPKAERNVHFRDFSPQNRPKQSPFLEESWDLPEDGLLFHGSTKLKTSFFPPEKELPEYPYSGSEQGKRVFPRMLSNLDRTFQPGSLGNKNNFNLPMNLTSPPGERGDNFKVPYDSFRAGSACPPSNPLEWKWEGTIAKGGTLVCRARCFPVGKVLDIMLPEVLNCTARTGLDMLAKHYYQASNAWVVFFVPGSDADMSFYNEFLNFLGDKQRAAVAKLDEKNTLFLVPPSTFSEKVLKVPGKLSISGVVLRLDQPSSNFGTFNDSQEKDDPNFTPFHTETSFPHPSLIPHPTSFEKSGINDRNFAGTFSTSVVSSPSFFRTTQAAENNPNHPFVRESMHDYDYDTLRRRNPTYESTWSSPHHMLNDSNHGPRNDPIVQEQQSAISNQYKPGTFSSTLPVQEYNKPSVSTSTSISALHPDQLAQLASSLLGRKSQAEKTPALSMGGEYRNAMGTTHHQSENPYIPSQRYGFQNNSTSSELSTSQYGHLQQLHQHHQQDQQYGQASNVLAMPHNGQRENQSRPEGSQHQQSSSATQQEEAEADPQKRLQATLQLAAALLQQIQQGKGT